MVAGVAWAAGTAFHSSPSTVKFRAAASTDSASSGASGSTETPGLRRLGGFGLGTVTSVNGSTITVSRPARPSTGASPNTPGAAPAPPTTTTKTIKVVSSTTYYLVAPGKLADVAKGDFMTARGTAGANGTLTATQAYFAAAGIVKMPNKAASAPGPAYGAPPAPPADAPVAIGTVSSVTQQADGSVTVVLSSPRGTSRTVVLNSSTQLVEETQSSLSAVQVNDMIAVRGTRNSDGSITAAVVQVVSAALKGQGPLGVRPGFGPGRFFGPGRGGFGGHGRWGPVPGAPAPATPGSGATNSNSAV
jgi:hypothetical protein